MYGLHFIKQIFLVKLFNQTLELLIIFISSINNYALVHINLINTVNLINGIWRNHIEFIDHSDICVVFGESHF